MPSGHRADDHAYALWYLPIRVIEAVIWDGTPTVFHVGLPSCHLQLVICFLQLVIFFGFQTLRGTSPIFPTLNPQTPPQSLSTLGSLKLGTVRIFLLCKRIRSLQPSHRKGPNHWVEWPVPCTEKNGFLLLTRYVAVILVVWRFGLNVFEVGFIFVKLTFK